MKDRQYEEMRDDASVAEGPADDLETFLYTDVDTWSFVSGLRTGDSLPAGDFGCSEDYEFRSRRDPVSDEWPDWLRSYSVDHENGTVELVAERGTSEEDLGDLPNSEQLLDGAAERVATDGGYDMEVGYSGSARFGFGVVETDDSEERITGFGDHPA